MNLIVNAPPARSARACPLRHGAARAGCRLRPPAFARSRRLGPADARPPPWSSTSRASTASGDSLIYFVDRYQRLLDLRRRLRAAPGDRARARRRWPGCTGSASCSPSWPIAPATGSTSTRRFFGFARAAARASISACCPRARCSRARATSSTSSSIEPPPGSEELPGRRAWCGSAWAPRTSRGRPGRSRRARHRIHRPRRGAAEREGRAHPGVPGRRELELVSSHLAP